ncbi:uncharacterized protein HMPREF1541_06652 [Cyphellophora europaea CBS 101466]|uniref:Heterokaryon incompatibility domain-containing protein n=1 Tax=Cyphellophora europaea (strain CBS 101466) TaxID=1220924 RepID=W2RQL8_CYPE1|nr:uncharacterized protein HMPREF1541_06652 [Cyphellophora europaea CBS 101466]ETN38615.1 hypothetical protein HMPREF1541_06652 [Cyphellophora europaea CBS 101466]
MQVTDLAHLRREYTCLSYVWGDEPADHSIKINGITVGIRTNLLDFLRVAVSRYASQWLWIDALCIDQNCPLERNHQVRQMAQIYSRAARVLAWLGRGSGRAMDQAPYWNRMWIKQELMLNRNVLLLYGLESISLQNFITNLVHGNSRLRDANPRPQNKPADNPMQNTRRFEEAVVHVPGMSPAEGTCLLVQDFQRSKSYPLTKLVFWFMDAGCKDPRDKVYALVALASDALEDFVDYQRSVVGVYCKTLTMWHDKTAALWDIVSFAVDLADNMCLKSTALYTQPRYTTCIHEVKLITVGAIDACKQPLRFHVHTTWSKLREQLSQSSNLTNSLTSYFDDRSESQSIGTRNGTQFLVFIDARDEIINRSDDDHADRTIFIARQTQGSLKHICFGFKPIWYSHDSNNLEYSRFQRRAERFSYPTKGNYTFVRLLPTMWLEYWPWWVLSEPNGKANCQRSVVLLGFSHTDLNMVHRIMIQMTVWMRKVILHFMEFRNQCDVLVRVNNTMHLTAPSNAADLLTFTTSTITHNHRIGGRRQQR